MSAAVKFKRIAPRYDTVGIAFFRYGYSVKTISGHYKCDSELIEDKIRKYLRAITQAER